jgi:hypothetical protein
MHLPSTQIIPEHFIILRPKHLPLHPILKCTQPVLLLKLGKSSSTPFEDSRQYYSSAGFISEKLQMGLKLQ